MNQFIGDIKMNKFNLREKIFPNFLWYESSIIIAVYLKFCSFNCIFIPYALLIVPLRNIKWEKQFTY